MAGIEDFFKHRLLDGRRSFVIKRLSNVACMRIEYLHFHSVGRAKESDPILNEYKTKRYIQRPLCLVQFILFGES